MGRLIDADKLRERRMKMEFNLEEAVPYITTEDYNCLIRNGVKTYEKLADMTDYDIAMLKYQPKVQSIICLRDKAKYYRDNMAN